MKKILHKVDKARLRFVKAEFVLLMTVLVLLAMVFSRPEIIGYASTNIHSQDLNLVLDHSQSFYLRSISGEPVHLTSLTVSGEVLGNGTASVYMGNEDGIKHLVFRNLKRKDSTHNRITGTSVAGSTLSGLSVTGNAVPPKEEGPILDLLEGSSLHGFETVPAGYRTVTGTFNHVCVETCLLTAKNFVGNRFRLDFYVEPGTKLKIKDLVYTTLEEI